MDLDTINEICEFWLSTSLSDPKVASDRREWWYSGGAAVDGEIRTRFGRHVERACQGELADWHSTAHGSLALILLLDQFTRNIYRGTPGAYAGDPIAYKVMQRAVDIAIDRNLHAVERIWLYHPLHHSEDISDQDRGLELLKMLHEEVQPSWRTYVERSITGWTRHRNIVARYGRFPHRNQVLGRESSEEEMSFLANDGESFGQGRQLK